MSGSNDRDRASGPQSILIEHLNDAVLFVRPDTGDIVQANSAAAALYGYEIDVLTKMRIFDLVAFPAHSDTLPPDATRGGQIGPEGATFDTEHRVASSKVIPVEVTARLIEDNSDDPVILAVVRDLSERYETRRAVQDAHDELDQVFNTATDGMRVVDTEFNVIRANQTHADMAGRPLAEIMSSKCHESYGGEHCGTSTCSLRLILEGEVPEPMEMRKQRADGTWMDVILTARPFVKNGEIIGMVEDFRDITDRKRAEERAHFLATHDALTWLPNRLLFHDRLSLSVAAAERGHGQPGVLYFDIDDFKGINDTFGHAAGDDVLCCIAEVLQGALRKADTAARLGGDEFIVLLPNADNREHLEAVAEKLIHTCKTCVRQSDGEVTVTVSMGATLYTKGDTDDSFIARADEAMYAAKYAGGNRFVFHSG